MSGTAGSEKPAARGTQGAKARWEMANRAGDNIPQPALIAVSVIWSLSARRRREYASQGDESVTGGGSGVVSGPGAGKAGLADAGEMGPTKKRAAPGREHRRTAIPKQGIIMPLILLIFDRFRGVLYISSKRGACKFYDREVEKNA